MKFFVLAMVLVVVQATPPVPRKAPDKQAAQRTKNHEAANTDQQDAAASSPSTPNPSTPQSNGVPEAEKHKDAEETIRIRELPPVTVNTGPDWWTRTYVLLTAALVGVGICGVLYAKRSLNAIQSQLERMKEQVTEMQNAGKQTQQIIDRMKDTAERELRAYVCVGGSQLAFFQERAPEVQVEIRNYGKTPAYDVKMWIGVGLGTYPLAIPLQRPPEGFGMSSTVLAPGEEPHAMLFRHPVIPEDLMKILGTPQLTMFVHGEVTYTDAFGKKQFTKYRLMFGGKERVRLKQKNGFPFAFLKPDKEGNEAS